MPGLNNTLPDPKQVIVTFKHSADCEVSLVDKNQAHSSPATGNLRHNREKVCVDRSPVYRKEHRDRETAAVCYADAAHVHPGKPAVEAARLES